jgi:hypothetical protein
MSKIKRLKSQAEYEAEYKAKIKAKADKVPLETKQKILDLLREGNTIGEIREIVDLELMVVCEIISQNIRHVPLLREKAR